MVDPISRVIRALESGDYSGAKAILSRHLKTKRTDTRALYFLGVAEQALNAPDAALALFDRVLAVDPRHAKAQYSKALLLMNLEKHEDALKHHALAVQLDPRNFWARLNRGNTFAALKKFDKALEDYEAVIAMAPDLPEAWDNKGNVLRELKRPEEALASHDHALRLRPEYAEAWSNRGNALLDLGRPEEALASNDRALKLKPEYAEAWSNRGNALLDLRRPEEALDNYHHALKLKPKHAEAWSNRGNALAFLKRREEALKSYDCALELKPDYPEALNNRGQVLLYLNRQEDAAQAYARLLELAPDFRFAKGDLLHAKMLCCDWGGLAALAGSIETDLRAGKKSTEPFEFQAISSSAQDLRRCAEIYAAERFPRAQVPVWTGERYRNARIRIGYVSGDFRNQATSILIAGLFELHDRNRFELFAFDNGWDDASEIRGRINRAFDEIVDITRLRDLEAAATIKRSQIDILINLNGYFGEARQGIFALKPCPIQVNYLGFPGTLGVDYMDYILADRHVIPAEHEACYTEKVVYLPDTYQVNDSRRVIAERTPSRAEVGLPDTGFVFCCFNNSYKITPEIFDRWMRLLGEVPGSVLWLLESNAAASRNLRHEAQTRGVVPERLIFAPRMKLEDHLARHRLADLFLDTLPYNAHTTASDALWAGLPVLTCQGTTFPGRVGASLLNAIGLPELITYSLDEYEGLARELASSPERLAEIRSKLARNRGTFPLFDTDRFRRHIEAAYTTMWERYQRGEPPESFAVAPIDNGPPLKKRRSEGETLPREASTVSAVAAPMPDDVEPGLTPAGAMQRALEHQLAGNPGSAEALYRSILSAYPQHLDALHQLGILKAQGGLFQEALQLFNEALRIDPRSAEANLNLGNVLAETGRAEEALASYDQALAIRPDFAEALYCRGSALQALKRHEEALASYDRALAIVPGRAEILVNRGNALHDLKRYEEALASYDQAVAIKPGVALLHNNRGNTLRELGRFEEALASIDRALAIAPDYMEALNNRGNTLQGLRRYAEALASLDLALVSNPDDAVVHHNRGNVLQDLQRYEDALASYDKALAFRSDFAEALRGRGNAHSKLGRLEEAVDGYEKALAISPDLEYLSGNLAWARMQCCDWRGRNEEFGRLANAIQAGKQSAPPLAATSIFDSPRDLLLCSKIWVRDQCAASPAPIWKGERYRHERIRVAYVSAEFRAHPSCFLIAGVFEHHDRSRFETLAISFGPDDRSEIRARVKGAFEEFIDVRGRSDSEVARLLREREVDIAVDLTGYLEYSRMGIFALRPAPVQVSYLGFPGTMGADFIDYILADRFVIPEEHHPHYTEKVVYLPDTFQANDSKRRIAERTPSRAEADLPEDGFVFCSFNNTYKFTPGMFDIWMRLLGRVEGSVLWLQQVNETAVQNLRREAIERGIDAKRLIFAPRVPRLEDHLARYRLADLFLDTLPYNAQTTASDALWAGLPVLTCLGTTFVGRVAASLLNGVGLPELITHSLDEYESLALELARNPKHLADIKAKLARNRGTFPLFDTDRFRRHIEAAYTTMWERYQRGEPPESFAVEAIER